MTVVMEAWRKESGDILKVRFIKGQYNMVVSDRLGSKTDPLHVSYVVLDKLLNFLEILLSLRSNGDNSRSYPVGDYYED